MPTLAELVSQAKRYEQPSKPDLAGLVSQAKQYDQTAAYVPSSMENPSSEDIQAFQSQISKQEPTTMPDLGMVDQERADAPAKTRELVDPARLAKRFAASALNYTTSGIKSVGTSLAEGFRAEMGDPLSQETKTPMERLETGLEEDRKPTVDMGPPQGFWDKVADTAGSFVPMMGEFAVLNAAMPGGGLVKGLKEGGRLAKLGAAAVSTARSAGAFAAQTAIREGDNPQALAEGAGMGGIFGAIEQIPGASVPVKLGKTVLESVAMERAAAYHGGNEEDRLIAFLTPWGIKAGSKAGKVIAEGLFGGKELKPSRTGLGDPGKAAPEREAIIEAIKTARDAADPQTEIGQKMRLRMQIDESGQATLTPATEPPPKPTPRARAKELGLKVDGLSDEAVAKRVEAAEASKSSLDGGLEPKPESTPATTPPEAGEGKNASEPPSKEGLEGQIRIGPQPGPDAKWFHGTSSPIENMDYAFNRYQSQNLYGPGLYLTDSLDVAKSYTSKGGGKKPSVYEVAWSKDTPPNLVDLEAPMPPTAKQAISNAASEYVDEIDWSRPGKDVYSKLKSNMRDAEITRSEAEEILNDVAFELEKAGYDGFWHVGGTKMGVKTGGPKHGVTILFSPVDSLSGKTNVGLSEYVEPQKPAPATTRGELANPAQTTETRLEVMKVDDTRRRAPVRPDEQVETEARQMLESDYEGTKQKIVQAGERGGQLNDQETVAAREIITKEGIKMLSSGDDASVSDFRRLVEAYRNTGTAQAEAFRSRRDQIESPGAKIAAAITEAAFSPSKSLSKDLKAAKTPDAKAKVESRWMDEIKKMREVLDKNNIDLATIFGPGAKEAAAKEPTWIQKKSRKARQELVQELDDFGKFLQGRAFSTPLDPEILARTTKFVGKAVKAGALSFAEFAEYAATRMGRETVKKLEPYLQEAWKTVKLEREAEQAAKPKKPAAKRMFKSASKKSMDEPIALDEVFAKQDLRDNVDPAAAIRVLKVIQTSKSDPWDARYEYWRNSILSMPTTHAANIVGNTGHMGWHYTAERMLEAAVNTVMRQPDAAQWGEFKYILGGALPGISKGYRDFLRTMRDEVVINERTKLEETNVAISGLKGRIIRTPQTMLLAEDAFATAWIGNMEAPAQAYRIGKKDGLKGDALKQFIAEQVADTKSEAWKRAVKVADELTFKGTPGPLGQLALQARRVPFIGRYLLPFVTTPSNIFRTGISKSPLGAAKLAADILKATNTGDWSKIPKGVAQQIIAWGVTGAIMGMMDDDSPWITGASTPSRQIGERTMAQRTYPLQSIRIPFTDTWVSYSRVEPFATSLGLIVDSVKALRSGGSNQVPQGVWESVRNQISSKTFLQGVGDMIEAFDSGQGSEDKLARWASSFVVSWVPNVIRGTGRATQETYPERGVWGKGEEWRERLGRRTVQKLELGIYDDVPAVDIWGREAPRSAMGNRPMTDFMFRILLPTVTKKEDVFIGDRVLMAWNRLNPDDPKYPGIPQKYYTDRSGVTKYMSDEEYYQYLTMAGQITSDILMGTSLDDEMPTEKDIKKIEDAISEGRSKAKKALFDVKR